MAQPTRSDVHVNRPLTSISTAYIQDAKDFVASEMFPVVPVEKQSDRYFTYTKADWFRDEMKIRAPGTESAGSGFNVDNTPSYFCDIVGNEDFTMLERTHRSRINVEVWIKLLDKHLEATGFHNGSDRRRSNSLAERGANATRDNDVFGAGFRCLRHRRKREESFGRPL
jgi:hypothetical protein